MKLIKQSIDGKTTYIHPNYEELQNAVIAAEEANRVNPPEDIFTPEELIEYESTAYRYSRAQAYNNLNQDEMRYDDLINGTTTWPDAIAAIKLAHPKPS